MKKRSLRWAVGVLAAGAAWASAAPKLNVVATLPDFGAIAQEVGGANVKVTSLCRGTEDAHFVDARPSFIRLLNQADLLIEGGAELEAGWLPPLLNSARNAKILGDGPGRVDVSRGISLLEVPAGSVDRSMGDVHRLGNPHYWTDPANGKIMATNITAGLSRLDPPNAALYWSNCQLFAQRLDSKLAQWCKMLEPYRGTKVITYHKSFSYFLARFGFQLADTIEPKPGIEPSPTHISALVSRLKGQGVKLVIIEPFRPRKTPEYVAQAIGARLVVLPDKVGGVENVRDELGLFDYNVAQVLSALKETGAAAGN